MKRLDQGETAWREAEAARLQGVAAWNFDEAAWNSFQQLILLLENVQLADRNDKWEWTSSSSGEFSVKVVKRLLYSDLEAVNCYVMDWCQWTPAKCNTHAWRTEMDKIPTGEALRKRNIQIEDTLCPLCRLDEETTDHLFISCYIASSVWNGVSAWYKIPNIFAFSIKDLLGMHLELRASERKKVAVQGIIIIVCWSLWRARNNFRFANTPVKIDSILSEVKALSFLWFSNRSKFKGVEWGEWCSFVNM
ncbi:uncharacterized protein LOC110932546 [Helianthus annuus]|uniref:uncharacterized protein LOC110932546 n=1 Tax=Helianthus annuus TaxID=4232 RepID=UPI000B8F2F49|nr:uncharacterized protein LOC110932546 [Helianthus annuus]